MGSQRHAGFPGAIERLLVLVLGFVHRDLGSLQLDLSDTHLSLRAVSLGLSNLSQKLVDLSLRGGQLVKIIRVEDDEVR